MPRTSLEEERRALLVADREGLNAWYERNVGYRPDDDLPGDEVSDLEELRALCLEMLDLG